MWYTFRPQSYCIWDNIFTHLIFNVTLTSLAYITNYFLPSVCLDSGCLTPRPKCISLPPLAMNSPCEQWDWVWSSNQFPLYQIPSLSKQNQLCENPDHSLLSECAALTARTMLQFLSPSWCPKQDTHARKWLGHGMAWNTARVQLGVKCLERPRTWTLIFLYRSVRLELLSIDCFRLKLLIVSR